MSWTERRLLILGMTYPTYSYKYVENVCTGALLEDTAEMVRIHPVPARYLEPGQRFKNFQWVRAQIAKHEEDPRPESMKVKPESIIVEEEIPSRKADLRRKLLDRSPHLARSVEDLRDRWRTQSLGIVRPKEITAIRLKRRPPSEAAEWAAKEKELLSQETLPTLRAPKPLDFPEVEFIVGWTCDDPRCTGHEMGLKGWGLHELYRKLAADPDRESKVLAKMRETMNLATRDVYLFLGTLRTHQTTFALMDAYYPPRNHQIGLFGRPT